MQGTQCPNCMKHVPLRRRISALSRVQVCPHCGAYIVAKHRKHAHMIAFLSTMLVVQVAISFSRWIMWLIAFLGLVVIQLFLSVYSRIGLAIPEEADRYERSGESRNSE